MKDFAMQLTQKCVSMGLLDESYSEWFALSYYKYTDKDLIKRVSMLIKAREIADFDDMVKNYPEEVEEQVDKIKKVL